jgi:hypothetical protein
MIPKKNIPCNNQFLQKNNPSLLLANATSGKANAGQSPQLGLAKHANPNAKAE